MLTDIKYGWRLYRRAPVFSLGIVLTLALGIGLNTAVFSVVNAVLVRPLAFPHAERLVWVAPYNDRGQDDVVISSDFSAWRDGATAFERLAGFFTSAEPVDTGDQVLQAHVASVTDGFWDITGAHFALGGPPSSGRDGIVLGQTFFQRWFHGDRAVIGRPVFLGGRQNVVTGVLAADFHPQLVSPPDLMASGGGAIDLYSANIIAAPPAIQILNVVGRLKPGISLERARQELDRLRNRQAAQGRPPDTMQLRVVPYADKVIGDSRRPLLILQAAVGLLLLIVCVNVANLLLVHGTARQREIAIRAAIGAGRVRIVRQFFVEILVLAVAGAAAGLVAASGGLTLLLRLLPLAVPRFAETTIDVRVLLFAFSICIAATLIFALAPALATWRSGLSDALKDAPRSASSSARAAGARSVLVTTEVASSVILLVAAGLMVKSIWSMTAYPPGFAPNHVLTMQLQLSGPRYRDPQNRRTFIEELLRRAGARPEVEAAGVGSNGDASILLTIAGEPDLPPDQRPHAVLSSASEGYAAALGMRVIEGRWLTDREPAAVFVINESLAREAFAGVDPVGKRIRLPFVDASSTYATVVGVVADLHYSKLGTAPQPELFLDYAHSRIQGMTLTVRTRTTPMAAAPALRAALSGLDRSQPPFDVKPLDVALADSIAPQRLDLLLLATFAASALVLVSIGIYGVIAAGVAERTRELGIRIALGASRGAVAGMVARQAMTAALAGIVLGVAAALAVTRILSTLLYEVTPRDAATFAAAVGAVSVTALVACWGPAVKASRIDPLTALRSE